MLHADHFKTLSPLIISIFVEEMDPLGALCDDIIIQLKQSCSNCQFVCLCVDDPQHEPQQPKNYLLSQKLWLNFCFKSKNSHAVYP